MSEAEDESRRPGEGGEIPLEEIQHPETMYDHSDLSARGIVYFLVVLAITVAAIHLIAWSYFRYSARQPLTPVPRTAAIITPSRQAGPKGDPVLRFPAPQVQPDPVADLNKFRAAVEQRLNSSGADHISIEQAIDQVAKSGLPVRPPATLPPRADFGSGHDTPAGLGGGTNPKGNE